MPHRETTIEAWTLPNLGTAFERKFSLTGYVSERSFTLDYSAGGGGSLSVAREFPRFSEFVHVDSTNHANDVGSIVRISKDGAPVTHYLARRFEDNVDPKATKLPVTLQSLDFYLDRAGVAPYDHDPLDDANSPNPTLDPDWEYGAESILRVLGNEFANEVQRIWRSAGTTMGTFKLSDGVDTTLAMDWNVSASVMRTRLETDIASIVNVIVRGDGTLKTPWEVEFTDPAGDIAYTLSIVDDTTDDLGFTVSTVRNGGTLDPSPWHRSYNAVTKTEHGNYDAFEVVHRDDVPAGLQAASTDEYFLRVNLDSVNDPEDYGGAQVIANVNPGSIYRASVPVWAVGVSYDFRLVLRHLDEAHINNGGDIAVPADTLWTLDIPPFKMGNNTHELVYRVGILETANIGDVYIAFQSAILAPGFDEEYLGKIMNDMLVPINARGLLTWVTPTWTDTLDSAGNVWDQKLQWTISHRQSLLQLVEFAKEWGYESSGIYWHEGNSRFQWDLFNPGGGGQVITNQTIVTGDVEGTSPVMHRLPGASSSWAFGRNGAWGRYEDADLLATVGRLEVMDLDRQSRDNLTVHAQERISAEKESASGQRLRLRTDRFTAFVDMSPGDFVEVNLGPRFINGIYRIAGITDAVDEEGNEYQEFHIGTLVKDAATAETDTVRELYRKFQLLGGEKDRGGVVDPTQQNVPEPPDGTWPFLVAAWDSPDEWKAVAGWVCDQTDDQVEILEAATAAAAFPPNTVYLAPGYYSTGPMPVNSTANLPMPSGVSLEAAVVRYGQDAPTVYIEPASIPDPSYPVGTHRTVISLSNATYIKGIGIYAWQSNDDYPIDALWMRPTTQAQYCTFFAPGYGVSLVCGQQGAEIDRCSFYASGPTGIYEGIRAENSWQFRVTNSWFYNWQTAIHIAPGLNGILCYGYQIKDNYFELNEVADIQISRRVLGTPLARGQYGGMEISGNLHYLSADHTTAANGAIGAIWIEGDSADQPIAFDSTGGTDTALASIHNNRFIQYRMIDGGAIHMLNTREINVHDNEFQQSRGPGVLIDGGVGNRVHHNSIMGPNTDSTGTPRDGILLTGAGGYNRIEANRITEEAGEAWRYGINIDDALQVGNIIIANDLRHLPGATAPINDAGTSTILNHAAHVTYGDNWT